MISYVKATAVAAIVCLGLFKNSFAQDIQCPDASDGDGDQFFSTAANFAVPTADERHGVEDFISRYAWLMDNRMAGEIGALFAQNGTYLLCQIGSAEIKNSPAPVGDKITESLEVSFQGLVNEKKRARRLFNNILIRKDISDQTFDALISSVVFTQTTETTEEPPKVDYMATLYATIEQDSFGKGLRFRSLTVVTDPQGIKIRAR